mmetsp:Transcript_11551/g.34854  ORF Transcript_11551/g.34854 Transcript_11551/m.34854 type:complete len:218 (+) Transcript_11551:195-848(+)
MGPRFHNHSLMPTHGASKISRCAGYLGHPRLVNFARTAFLLPARTRRTKRAISSLNFNSSSSLYIGRSTFLRISSSLNISGSTPSSWVRTLRFASSPAQMRPSANTSMVLRSCFVIWVVSAQPHISGARHQQDVTLCERLRDAGEMGRSSSLLASLKPCKERDMPKSQMTARTDDGPLLPNSHRMFSGFKSRWIMSALCRHCRPMRIWNTQRLANTS